VNKIYTALTKEKHSRPPDGNDLHLLFHSTKVRFVVLIFIEKYKEVYYNLIVLIYCVFYENLKEYYYGAYKRFLIENGVLENYVGNDAEVGISECVTSIGNSEFSLGTKPRCVVIPEGVTSMGENVFYKCTNLTIHAPSGSYAEQYAKENEVNFIAE